MAGDEAAEDLREPSAGAKCASSVRGMVAAGAEHGRTRMEMTE